MNHQLAPPRVVGGDVLYLDFDGVLHPQDVWVDRGEPYVRSPQGHRLFENTMALTLLLQPYPDLRIVLSTTWVRRLGYKAAVMYLSPELRSRCVGATWHRGMGRYRFDFMTRGEQVLDDVSRRCPSNWLAIDDDASGWGAAQAGHLIATHPVDGLSHPSVFLGLSEALLRFAK